MVQQFAHYPSLDGKIVFVTGGATGIGESIVEHFCTQGALVTFVDIDDRGAGALVERLGAAGLPIPQYQHCDITDLDALRAAIGQVEAAHGGVDVLVNNAANDDRHAAEAVDFAYWRNRMDVNLHHHFFAAQAVRAGMSQRGGGSIINLGSIMVQMGAAGSVGYVTAKGAIQAMTRALAREFGAQRIRVNCLIPGWVMTQRQIALYLDESGEQTILARQCLPDKLVPADVARMALFLAADDSLHCTSQNFTVDGGWV